jgi:hypothetical protein
MVIVEKVFCVFFLYLFDDYVPEKHIRQEQKEQKECNKIQAFLKIVLMMKLNAIKDKKVTK